MLHTLAETYGMLPSQVLDKADTLDLWVYDVAVTHRNKEYERRKLKINSNTPQPSSQNYDIVTLQEMMNRVPGKQK
jgi:hypothetical protein